VVSFPQVSLPKPCIRLCSTSCDRTKISAQVRVLLFDCFSPRYVFRRGIVTTSPNPQVGTPPLLGSPELLIQYICSYPPYCGPSSVFGIATGDGLDGPGIESQWGARFSAPVQTGPGAHPASCTMGTGSLPGVKSGRVVTLTPHPLLVPWS
jgi:hypothetical protein